MKYKVAMLIGSETDREIVENANPYFDYFGITLETYIMSAHRNPSEVSEFCKNARDNGYSILIGGGSTAVQIMITT